MALIIMGAGAYAAYIASKQGEGDSVEIPPFDESFDLSGKIEEDLLPMEVTLDVLETSMTTITFMKGNYKEASTFLRKRVADIVYRNPFLGGWLVVKPGERFPKLVYDPSSDHVCEGIIQVLEPGQVNLSYPETPYEEYGTIIGNHGRVPMTKCLINRQHESLFRVAVIPDALHEPNQFALVVSMSHQCGDPYTFYRIHSMILSGSSNDNNNVATLNPHRKQKFSEALFHRMGQQEAYYIRNALSSPLWEWSPKKKTEAIPIVRKMFYISNDWLEREQEAQQQDSTAGLLEPSITSLLSSWFFNLVQPTVGFIPLNFRNRLPECGVGNDDAGTYNNVIPFTSLEYATPTSVEKSLLEGKRCVGNVEHAPLPRFQRGATYSVTTDWSQYVSSAQFLSSTKDDTAFRPLLHLPLYSRNDIKVLPEKLSFLQIFAASPVVSDSHHKNDHSVRLGAFLVAPEPLIAEIEACGIIEEMIAHV